jgi:hypothetical protein
MKLPEIKLPKIKVSFRTAVVALVVILVGSIILLTCRDRKEVVAVLHPTKAEIEAAAKEKKQHELFVDSLNNKIARLEKTKDSVVGIVQRKDAEIEVKSLKISALTKQASLAKKYKDSSLFMQSCDTLIEQVDNLLVAVDVLQRDNRNVQDAYDSLLGATSLKMGRLEYDYSVLQERFDKVSKDAIQFGTSSNKNARKADKRIILGLQAGGTYSLWQAKPMPYFGVGLTYRIARF